MTMAKSEPARPPGAGDRRDRRQAQPRAERRDGRGGRGRARPQGHAPRGPRPQADPHRRGRPLRGAAPPGRRRLLQLSGRRHPAALRRPRRLPRAPPHPRPPRAGRRARRRRLRPGHGRVGVCMGTSGPGATNLVTGIGTALLDSIPMVAITGNVPAALIGKDAFQEIDINGITLPMTKHNYLVRDADELPARHRRGLPHRPLPAVPGPSTSTSRRTPSSRRRAPSIPPRTRSSPGCRASARTWTATRGS